MTVIRAFPGVHYDPSSTALEDVVAPPYDVLSPEQQNTLYEKSPHNIVRLILNRQEDAAENEDARYERAASFLREGLREGWLLRDGRPAIYEYVQEFPRPDNPAVMVHRSCVLLALQLEPYERGIVLPHEQTLSKARADRLKLMKATRANPEPIYGLYEDPGNSVAVKMAAARAGRPPMMHVEVDFGVAGGPEQHTIWRHENPSLIAEVEAFFAERRVWIADGHHRYETGLAYQKWRDEENPAAGERGTREYDYLLIGLSAFEDPGLVVLPTHRLVKNISPQRLRAMQEGLAEDFAVQEHSVEQAVAWLHGEQDNRTRIVAVFGGRALALTYRREPATSALSRLDVSILQTHVLEKWLGISWADLATTPDLKYTRSETEALQAAAGGGCDIAFLLQNPRVTEVRDVASAGDKMPQKSTFFYPKLWSGLVLRTLD